MRKVRDHGALGDDGERREHMAYVPPPRLAEAAVPVHGDAQPFVEVGALPPAELPQLGAVDCVAAVVEGPVVGVLDPFPKRRLRFLPRGGGVISCRCWGWQYAHDGEELGAEVQVGDFVRGTDIVNVPDVALVQNRVKRICGVAGVEVAPRGTAVAVEDDGLASVEEACEFGYDFFKE